jgi:3-isopropylmalate/(R)-2-methylmalate dehydratase small subunit
VVLDYGFRALIGRSFAEIFYGNCLQNGILPVVLDETLIHQLWAAAQCRPGCEVTIDLTSQVVVDADGNRHGFDITSLRKDRLLRGLDDIDVTQTHRRAIARFEAHRRQAFPWLPITSHA